MWEERVRKWDNSKERKRPITRRDGRVWTRCIVWMVVEDPDVVILKFFEDDKFTKAAVPAAAAWNIWNKFKRGERVEILFLNSVE